MFELVNSPDYAKQLHGRLKILIATRRCDFRALSRIRECSRSDLAIASSTHRDAKSGDRETAGSVRTARERRERRSARERERGARDEDVPLYQCKWDASVFPLIQIAE